MSKTTKIYNLYPKLVGSMDTWKSHIDRAHAMGFTYIYINPLHAPGFSGSDYAVKDYYLYHPLFVTGGYDFDTLPQQRVLGDQKLKAVCEYAGSLGLKIIMDLVINHTAIDSELTKTHPDWYEHNADGTIKNPGALDGSTWITWGDLAQIDNLHSKDRENLWKYWLDMMLYYANLGIRGFRCDAAYHLPSVLWTYLIKETKTKYPDAVFIAETLGCQTHELIETADTGFDCVFNSFKWWNWHDEWFLRLYGQWAGKYPSIAFPENHDTIRYAEEVGGRRDMAIMKYAVSAWLFSGIATTLGFEFGFRRKIDVVQANPSWWEEPSYDITKEISVINSIKDGYPILGMDTAIEPIHTDCGELRGFLRRNPQGHETIAIIFNTDYHGHHMFRHHNFFELMGATKILDISHGHRMTTVPQNLEYGLAPGEVKLFYSGPKA